MKHKTQQYRKQGTWMTFAILSIFAFSVLAGASAPAEKQGENDEQTGPALIWPLPPDPPRVRWVGQFVKFEDVEKKRKKKRSWFERLAGSKEENEPYRGLITPYGIASDSKGYIYVADWPTGGLLRFHRDRKSVDIWGPQQGIRLRQPLGVAVGEEDRVFVTDAKMGIVSVINAQGVMVAQFGKDELTRPVGIAVDTRRHRLYVTDTKAHRIAVFDSATYQFKQFLGKPSDGSPDPGTFNTPIGVAVDKRGFVYVADTFNHRVQIFNRRGRFVRQFGRHGSSIGEFSRPKGIAVDSEGHIYVADSEFNNFQIFDQQGRIMLFVGNKGAQPGQFTLLTGLYIDGQDRIYTTEQYRPRVQIFQYIPQPDTVAQKEVDREKQ